MNACACGLAALVLVSAALTAGAQTAPVPPARKPSAGSPQKPAAGTAEFNRLLKAATEARQAQRWEEAIELYGKIVKQKPGYVEGHWYQGTAYYSLDDFPQCRETFRKV